MAPRVSVTGKPLPSARAVSAAVHRDFNFHDHAVTTLLVSWSQMIDHDMAFGGTVPGKLIQRNGVLDPPCHAKFDGT